MIKKKSKPKWEHPLKQLLDSEDEHPLKSVVREIQVKTIKPIEEFTGELLPTLIPALAKMGSFSARDFARLIGRLHALAEGVSGLQDFAEYERKAVRALRPPRLKWGQARAHVASARKSLDKAKRSLPPSEMNQIKPGYLTFDAAEKVLGILEQRLSYLESICAAMIHPDKRTADEERLVVDAKLALKHADFPISAGCAGLEYAFAKEAAGMLEDFTRGKVPSNHIDKIISSLFQVALGEAVSEENVKIMRYRAETPRR